MTVEDHNSRFIAAARSRGMLTEQMAGELLSASSDNNAAATLVLQRGVMDARQVDMIQTLVSGSQSIPGYTIIDIIGYGGMGVVFRARQEALDRDVALKTILVGGRVEEAIRRFRNEAMSVAKLNHPNIVTAFDSGQHGGRIFLSMELVDGEDLTNYVSHRGTLPAKEALRITRQAAMGLAHAWEHGIVHRDIKPDNLLITAPSGFDQSRTVKIADLGLAQLNADSDSARITQTGATVGSPLYMAPEQLSGGRADCRTDIYSLGSTLYFMLCGRAPFAGDSVTNVLYNKSTGNSVPLSEVIDIDERVETLVNRMMKLDPQERPQDYQDVVREIDAISDTLNPSNTKPTAADMKTPRSVASRPSSVNDATLLQTEIVAVDTSTDPAAREQQSSGKPRWLVAAIGSAIVLSSGIFGAYHLQSIHQTAAAQRIVMERTWAAPLFDGQSQDRWLPGDPGTQWEVTPDPVEGAFALAVTARRSQEGSVRTRIAELSSSDNGVWFEVETNVLLHSAAAAGLQFGMTETSSGYRLRLTQDRIALLDEDGDELATTSLPPSTTDTPLHVRLRLQPTGWLAEANDRAVGAVPAGSGLLPEIRLFVEGGQSFFTGISAYGLRPAADEL